MSRSKMKLISATAISLGCLLSPQAASAEQVYLVVFAATGPENSPTMTSMPLPMESMEKCEAAGLKLQASNGGRGKIQDAIYRFRVGYECLLGGK